MALTFRSWLHEDHVRRLIVSQLAGGAREFESFAIEVCEYARLNPAITECDRTSLAAAIAKAGSFGVRVGDRGAFVIAKRPIGDRRPEAVAVLGYHGKVQLLKHYGVLRDIVAKPYYKNEPLRIRDGTHPKIEHDVITDIRERGPLAGGWLWAETPTRRAYIVVMDRSEIDAVRREWSDDYALGDLEDYPFYVTKTLVHQLEKRLQIPERIRGLIHADDVERPVAPVREPAAPVATTIDHWSEMQDVQGRCA